MCYERAVCVCECVDLEMLRFMDLLSLLAANDMFVSISANKVTFSNTGGQ